MDDGAASQPDDTVMSEAASVPPPQHDPAAHQQHQHQPPSMGMENIPATLSHGGRFIQYNIFGNIFEVTAKYKPPIMPIGKGAYGIVWSMRSLFLFFSNILLEFYFGCVFCLLLLLLIWGVRFDCFSSALNSETNEHVAIKKIANAFDNKIDAKRTLREIKLLRHMDHENVSE